MSYRHGDAEMAEIRAAVIAAYNAGTMRFSDLASRFQLSRNSIAGIVSRARLRGAITIAGPGSPIGKTTHGNCVGLRRQRETPAREKPARRPKAARSEPAKPAPRPPRVAIVAPVADLPEITGDPFEQRERRMLAFDRMVESRGCKFPVGDLQDADFHFCCAPRLEGQPYCPEHHALTHRPLQVWARDNRRAWREVAA